MNRCRHLLFATALFGVGGSTIADALPNIPSKAKPTLRCIHRVLESDIAVQSVDLYSVDGDGFRFAVEYSFRNKDKHVVVSDIEMLIEANGLVTETDNIPREIPEDTVNEGQDLVAKLNLTAECDLTSAFDNLIPRPKARADWQRMDWPN